MEDPVEALAERLMAGDAITTALPSVAPPGRRLPVLSALAARYLLTPGVVTASVIGSGPAVRAHLGAVARHVPGVSHVSVRTVDGGRIDRGLRDQLDLAGIGVSVADTACEAVFGATLVVVAGVSDAGGRVVPLPKGAVVVNATGRDLPACLAANADRVVVDDEALPRRPTALPVSADLRQVVTGERAGRTSSDHVLLVELLSVGRGTHQEEDYPCRSRTRSSGSW